MPDDVGKGKNMNFPLLVMQMYSEPLWHTAEFKGSPEHFYFCREVLNTRPEITFHHKIFCLFWLTGVSIVVPKTKKLQSQI